MKYLIIVATLFAIGSLTGYIIEVFFRRFVSQHRWVNPGFMKGPWLPLYGFGTIVMFTVCFLFITYLPKSIKFYNPLGNLFERSTKSGPTWFDLIPILTMWLGMNLLELVAGLIFIRGFKVKLWDYTNLKGNFKSSTLKLSPSFL